MSLYTLIEKTRSRGQSMNYIYRNNTHHYLVFWYEKTKHSPNLSTTFFSSKSISSLMIIHSLFSTYYALTKIRTIFHNFLSTLWNICSMSLYYSILFVHKTECACSAHLKSQLVLLFIQMRVPFMDELCPRIFWQGKFHNSM